MPYDPNKWKAEAIVAGLPRELLAPLMERDGTTIQSPFNNTGSGTTRPKWMYALGLVSGVAGAHVTGFDWGEWLTPLGQAVVDEMMAQGDR